MSALQATGLAKSYKSRQVVRDLSLELARGEVVGLLGPMVPARPPPST